MAAPVLLAGDVLVEETLDRFVADEALAAKDVRRQRVAREGLELPGQPGGGGDREPALSTAHDARRQQRLRRLAQEALLGQAAHLVSRRQREREPGHDGVEERHARLEGVRHRRAVRLDEQIVNEVRTEIDVLQTREELGSPAMQQFIDDLVETMHDADGAGLAAIQVYEPVQICAIEVRNNPRYPYKPPIPLTILVNPVLTPVDDEQFDNNEGCLSVPNLRGMVKRNASAP